MPDPTVELFFEYTIGAASLVTFQAGPISMTEMAVSKMELQSSDCGAASFFEFDVEAT